METRAFAPLYAPSGATSTPGTLYPSVTVAASTSAAASTAFPGGTHNTQGVQIQISNTTNGWAFVNFGVVGFGNTVTAATVASSYPVAPGAVVVVTVDSEVNGANVILAAGSTSGSVIFTRGRGL